jgi:hypothetical protein
MQGIASDPSKFYSGQTGGKSLHAGREPSLRTGLDLLEHWD